MPELPTKPEKSCFPSMTRKPRITLAKKKWSIKERQIYHEMKLTPAMVKSIRTLCGVCLRHYVETKAFKIAIVPNKDRCMETCTVCQTRRGYDYVVMPR